MGRLRAAALAGLLAALAGCAAPIVPCPAPAPGRDTVTLLSRGWHTEIGIRADRLQGGLAIFRSIFPGARTIMFGYGKRTFMTARADRLSEYLLGPFPGPAVIEAVGLSTAPAAAYGRQDLTILALPPGGEAALAAFIWQDLAKDRQGRPLLVGPGPFPGSLFYAAISRYTLAHTCNNWTIAALHEAGLPIQAAGVVFSGQAMARAADLAARQCPAPGPR